MNREISGGAFEDVSSSPILKILLVTWPNSSYFSLSANKYIF